MKCPKCGIENLVCLGGSHLKCFDCGFEFYREFYRLIVIYFLIKKKLKKWTLF